MDLLAECKEAERLKDEILECFALVQRAAHLFLGNFNSPLIESAKHAVLCEFFVRGFINFPLFSNFTFACIFSNVCRTEDRFKVSSNIIVSKHYFSRDWKLDIVGQNDEIKVVLIPIEMLNDPEIIADFVRRILYSGWTSKVQYETWFVTLLAVLCVTPTGNALNDEDVQVSWI